MRFFVVLVLVGAVASENTTTFVEEKQSAVEDILDLDLEADDLLAT